MKNKIIIASIFLVTLILLGVNSFAATNTMTNGSVQSVVNSAVNSTASAVNAASNVANTGVQSATAGVKSATNVITSNMNATTGVSATDAASANFLGISSVIWMWIMVIVIAVVIIMLVVKYVKERN